MAKRIVITSIAIVFLSLFCGVCFAAEDNMKMEVNDLGRNINESLDKAGQEVKNVTNDVMSGNMINRAREGLDQADRDTKEGINNVKNTAMAGMYNVTRTDTDIVDSNDRINDSILVWTIVAVITVVTISVIWYYVAQNNERKY